MGTSPIGKLLISMSLPLVVSMFVQAMYNVVDSIFVARIGENALTALSLAFPMQNFMISVATGTAVGINAILSKSLGEKNTQKVNKIANNGVFLAFCSYLVFLLLGIFFSQTFISMQTNDPEIIKMGVDYLSICMIGSFGMFFQVVFERLLQSVGKTFYTMITQLIGAVINIILDPILIFGMFGIPKMGVAGAAIATIAGQIVAAILAFFFNKYKNHEISLKIKGFKPELATIGRIYAIGVPSIIMMSISSVMTFLVNKILMGFTPTATAVFGVYFKLQSFIFMPVFGLTSGMVPIVAYNYGARRPDRMVKTIKLSCIYAIAIMAIGTAIFQIFPQQLLLLFEASEDLMDIGVTALRIISLSYVCAGFCITIGSVFQALGKGMFSMINSFTRQIVILIPVTYLLSLTGKLDLVWWGFPIADVASLLVTLIFLAYTYKKIIKPLKQDTL